MFLRCFIFLFWMTDFSQNLKKREKVCIKRASLAQIKYVLPASFCVKIPSSNLKNPVYLVLHSIGRVQSFQIVTKFYFGTSKNLTSNIVHVRLNVVQLISWCGIGCIRKSGNLNWKMIHKTISGALFTQQFFLFYNYLL